MRHRTSHEDLMRYLDGEMPDGDRLAVEEELEHSTELRRELAIYQAMRQELQGLSLPSQGPGGSVWDQVGRRIARPLGWTLLSAGVLVWAIYGAYVFVASPVGAWQKLGVGALVIGFLLLLGSVIAERYQEWLTDPYRNVHR